MSSTPGESVSPPRIPMLIAPAGGPDAMRAAVENGADGVYFGLPQFNARMRAENFTLDELPDLIAWLHERGVRAYVTLNTLIFDDELHRAGELFALCARAGADGVMIQDLGFAALANRVAPALPAHASTQMSLTCPEALRAVEAMGLKFERMVAARELTLDEIRRLREEVNVEIEVFAHGALCISVSGQCQASFALGGRSANRGECAQACRLPYEVLLDGRTQESAGEHYPLSPRDLAALDDLPALIAARVDALKIEGRMKSAQYVAAVVRRYREALDAAARAKQSGIQSGESGGDQSGGAARGHHAAHAIESEDARRELEIVFSRGFSHGFLRGANPRLLMNSQSPKHRGTLAGRVVRGESRGVLAVLETPLKPGDGAVFDFAGAGVDDEAPGGRIYEVIPAFHARGRAPGHDQPAASRGHHAGAAHRAAHSAADHAADKSHEVWLTFADGKFDPRKIPAGALVWKTSDPALDAALNATFEGEKIHYRRPVRAFVEGAPGRPLRLRLVDWEENAVEVEDSEPAGIADNRPLTKEFLQDQLSRLGSTPFVLESVEARLDGPVMVPMSRLNALRRRAADELTAKRRSIGTGRKTHNTAAAIEKLHSELCAATANSHKRSSPLISIVCRTLEQIRAAAAYRSSLRAAAASGGAASGAGAFHVIYAELENWPAYREAKKIVAESKARFGAAGIQIVKPGEAPLLQKLLEYEPAAILAPSLASLDIFKEFLGPDAGRNVEIVGGAGLNAANELTAGLLARLGLAAITPSPELDSDRLGELLRHAPPEWFEPAIYTRAQLFHTQYCLYCRHLSHGKDASNCGRPCRGHTLSLRDRKGETHPVRVDVSCRNTIFRETPTDLIPRAPAMWAAGVRRFRLEFLGESAAAMTAVIRRLEDSLAGAIRA